jgi:chromosome segregation protein
MNKRAYMPTKKKKKDALLDELEGVVDVLSTDMTTAMDIKKEKEELKNQIRALRKEETYLKDIIKKLKNTKDKLGSELQKKDHEESKLKEKLERARTEKRKEYSKNAALEGRVERLLEDKKELNASLIRMNEIIIKLKSHISDFDRDIKLEV